MAASQCLRSRASASSVSSRPRTWFSGRCTESIPRSARRSSRHRAARAWGGGEQAGRPRAPPPPRARPPARPTPCGCRSREVALGTHPVEVAGVERYEPAGGVEHVGRRRAPGVDIADGVREDGRHAGGVGELEHAGGVADARRTALRAVVAHDLDGQGSRWQGGHPPVEDGTGHVGAAGEHRPADLGVGAEQDGERARGTGRRARVLGDGARGRRPGTPRSPRRCVSDTSRHSRAQPTPAGRPAAGSAPSASTVTRGCRRSTALPPRTGVRRRAASAAPKGSAHGGSPVSSPVGSTARSTPSIGAIPAERQARTNFTAP